MRWLLCERIAKGDELLACGYEFIEVDEQSGDSWSGCGGCTEVGR